jgi:hypothetical protein
MTLRVMNGAPEWWRGKGTRFCVAGRFWVPHSSRLYRDGWGWVLLTAIPCPMGFNLDSARLAGEVVTEATPWPVFRFFDEASFDRVAVEVAQLFDRLFVGEDVEVVVTGLPEVGSFTLEEFGGLSLEDAQGGLHGVELRFAEEKVDVLGHEDVAEEVELVPLTESFEDFFEEDAGVIVVQVWETPVATEGDEVVVSFGLVTLETARHEVIVTSEIPGPHP